MEYFARFMNAMLNEILPSFLMIAIPLFIIYAFIATIIQSIKIKIRRRKRRKMQKEFILDKEVYTKAEVEKILKQFGVFGNNRPRPKKRANHDDDFLDQMMQEQHERFVHEHMDRLHDMQIEHNDFMQSHNDHMDHF